MKKVDLTGLNEQEQKFAGGIIEMIAELKAEIENGGITQEYFDAEIGKLKSELSEAAATEETATTEEAEKFQKQIDELTIKFNHIKQGNTMEKKSMIQQVKEYLTKESIQQIQKGGKVTMELKVDDMSIITSVTGDVARVDRKPDVVWLAESTPMLSNVIASIPTTGNSIEITEAYDELGAPIFHLEGAAGGQMSWKWKTKRFAVKDVSVWAKFSKNILDDVDNFIGQIQTKLFQRLDKEVDAKLLAGDEQANSEEFDGLVTIATAFTNSGMKTYKPTERDVLVAAVGQVEGYDHMANIVVINPLDKTKLKLAKAGKDNAILQFEDVANSLAGLQVITSTRMTAGKFLVFDSSKATQHVRMALEFGITDADSTDFTKRLLTLNLTKRLAFEVSANNYKAFVYGDFATAKAAMTLTT